MQMQTQTQMEMQASSHVQRKRKEREIRKRSRSIFPRSPTMIELLPIHTCEKRTQIQTGKCFIIQTTVLYKYFQPWGKPQNAIFFHVCLISPISCWYVTRLSRHSVRLTKEQQSLHHSQSKVVCRNIFELWLLENWNIRIDAYRGWRSNFLRKEKNQNTKWKTESYVFSGFDSGISRGWERKSTTGRFATGRLRPFTRMISSAGKDQFNTWEFCILKIRPIVFLLWFNACFHLEFANALYDLYSWIVYPFIFIH